MPIKLSAKAVAYGFPALIAFLGVILIMYGFHFSKAHALNYGWEMILIGVGLYLVYLLGLLLEPTMRTGLKEKIAV